MKMLKKLTDSETVSILKTAYAKTYIKKNTALLNRYHIKANWKNDHDFFFNEMIVHSLKNKEKIENAFLIAYDSMHDYWDTLVYTEKNHLINVELEPMYAALNAIVHEAQITYVPYFDERINHIYAHEMNLFELKQYDRLRFDISSIPLHSQLSEDMIRFGFTSLQLVHVSDNRLYAYCAENHTLYIQKENRFIDQYAFVQCDGDMEKLMQFVLLREKENELEILSFLLEQHWLNHKHEKKLEKYLTKLLK